MMTFRLSLFVLLSLCTFISQAQDIGLIGFHQEPYSEIKAGTTQNIRLHAKAYQKVTTPFYMSMKYKIDDGIIRTYPRQILVEKHNVGDSLPLIPCAVQFPNQPDDTVLVTIFLESANDKDASNDTLKQQFVLKERVANDLEVTVIDPTTRTSIEVGKPFDFVVAIKNVGTNYLEQGNILLSYVTIAGVRGTPTITHFSGPRLAPEDISYQTTTITLDSSLVGDSFDICHTFFWSQLDGGALHTIEGNHQDNDGCADYKGIPSSIDEPIDALLESVYYGSNHLVLVFHEPMQSQLEVRVSNISGKEMTHQIVDGSSKTQQLAIPGAQPGIYFLRMVTPDQRTLTRKFFIP